MSNSTLLRHARGAIGLLLVAGAPAALAQPTWGNPSPTAGSETSQKANAAADQTIYRPVEYVNAKKKGPALVVIPGEIKSNNANFLQKFTANNIADFGEIELSSANFQVLERSNLGPLLKEFELAYNLGDPAQARKFLGMGKLKATKYVVKFDILKTEQVASAQSGFDGRTLGQMAGLLGVFSGSRGGAAAGTVGGTAVGSVHSGESTSVWVIGMRYKIINAETTEQVAQGYTEEKMEIGATSSGALGVNQAQQGGVSLDTMVQRLVQKSVWEIDSKYK
jgi:curli biogenesis system outer membrane secretion channel CsgG